MLPWTTKLLPELIYSAENVKSKALNLKIGINNDQQFMVLEIKNEKY